MMVSRLRQRSVPLTIQQLADQDEFDLAVFRLMVIAEECGKLSDDLVARHTSLPWRRISGMRNLIAHAYDQVESEVIWSTLQTSLDPIEAMCRAELAANP